MGIDPVTHKPFSQIFTEFGKLSGPPNTINQNAFRNTEPRLKSEPFLLPQEVPNANIVNIQMIEQYDQPLGGNTSCETVSQLQPTNQDNVQPHFLSEISSSTLSASSSSSIMHFGCQSFSCEPSQLQTTPSSPTWNESIFVDPYLSTDIDQIEEGCKFQGISSQDISSFLVKKETPRHNFTSITQNDLDDSGNDRAVVSSYEQKPEPEALDSMEASSSAADSFVESILARDSQMQLEFSELLDGDILNY